MESRDTVSQIEELGMSEWRLIDESTPRKKTILFYAETFELDNGAMNWRMETGYIYPYDDGKEDWYWAGQRLEEWDYKPTHWIPLPTPPVANQQTL